MGKHLAAIFGDLHIHNYKQFNTDGNRLENCLNVLTDIFVFCANNGIKTIFFDGDLYDKQKELPTIVVNKTIERFLYLFGTYTDITVYAITGNHDQSTKNLIGNTAVSALTHIQSIFPYRFKVIDDSFAMVADGILVAGVPYYEYAEHFNQRLSELCEQVGIAREDYKGAGVELNTYLMIHQTPAGIGNKMIAYEAEPTDPLMTAFDHVFCGHIHARQQLTENFTVVGNPIHRDLADAGKQKGFLVMNLANPSKGAKFIPLPGYPEFKEKYEDDEITEEDAGDFVVRIPRLDSIKLTENASVENFNTNLQEVDLVTNYWQEVDGKNQELLKTGLSFLK